MKKICSILVAIFICTFMLIGCGTIEINTSTNISENESGTMVFQIRYDDSVSNYINGTIFNQEWASNNGFSFNNYVKDNYNVEEVKYKFNNLKELEDKINSTKLIDLNFNKKLGFGKETYNINIKFDKTLINDIVKKGINTGNEEKDNRIYSYIQDMKITNYITVPGTYIDSNSSESFNSNSKSWTYKLSQLDENTNINISYSIKNNILPSVIICIAIIGAVSIGYVYYKKRK